MSNDAAFSHEQIRIHQGSRSGLPVLVAVHSTALGQAIGGCRIARYPSWRDGLTDVLRLSAAMTDKCAVAGLANGGGKVVVAVPPDAVLDQPLRRAVLHDVGDVIESLGGQYATGPDVGTDPDDMVTIAERTGHVFCQPPTAGGSGDSSTHTASGVLASVRAVCDAVFGTPELAGRSFAILGLGRVGGHLARHLAAAGAELVVSDIDAGKRGLAGELGAGWLDPDDAFRSKVDVLVPAALGGQFTAEAVRELNCAAVAGPANNQLSEPGIADLLHERGILWAPDFVVSAGGVIHAISVELHRESEEQAAVRVARIGDTVVGLLATARSTGTTPAAAAQALARERIAQAR
jgi:leucine dehydrogenase